MNWLGRLRCALFGHSWLPVDRPLFGRPLYPVDVRCMDCGKFDLQYLPVDYGK
jgi:hypothetical protein